MRLLKLEENGEFTLTKDITHPTTPYAILSHTWGEDEEEVNFGDLKDGSGKTKIGYKKLQFCGEQAARDNLQFFWVDTCCIDKSNNNELSEAINSMFRWYRNAAKCYVYLIDVLPNDINLSLQQWEAPFRNSRWFTRGWTLQELIAPPSVEFFCRNGKPLGNKKSLERQLHEITGIPVTALQGTPTSEFSVDERTSWAEHRRTKREEDKAYSLLGIFDVYIPLIYGEGVESATSRLREAIDKCVNPQGGNPLDSLPYAAEALFNSYQRQDEPPCLDNTRVDILRQIHRWAELQDERYIFWLSGLAGTGKSTIARTTARRYFEDKRLGASFFFTKGGGDAGHASKFVTSVALQLARNVPSLQWHIRNAIIERSDIACQSLRDQWHQLVLRPLSKLNGSKCYSSYILIIDALDECNDDNSIKIILQLLAEARSLRRVRLRAFLTSRPEIPIRHGFLQIPETEHQDFVLHNISPSIIDHDIFIFLEHTLRLIGQERSLNPAWPGEDAIRKLVQIASGLFIWASTACRFVSEGKRLAVKRLSAILDSTSGIVIGPEKHLDKIYTTVLNHSIGLEYTDDEKEDSYCMLRQVLGSVAILFSPLPIYSLSSMLRVSKDEIDQILEDLHSIVDIPKRQNHPLRLHHPSFRDFLLNNDRCKDPNFWVDEKQAHQTLADSCIRLMSMSLKQYICGLNNPGLLLTNVDPNRIQDCIPLEVQYASLYWIQHFQRSGIQLHDNGQVHQFLQEHLLHWLETLGWMGKISEGIYAIAALESIALASDCPELYAFVCDTKRFALYGRQVIEQAPLQVYCSTLIFAPMMSIVRKQCEGPLPQWVQEVPKVENHWSAILQTLEGHSSSVTSVAFSHDSKLLASASDDTTVRLWDAATGTLQQTLEGHSGCVASVAFSHDSKLLVSVSDDRTVRLWDTATGTLQQTLEGHSSFVTSVAFSHDSKLLASASWDTTVRLWDAAIRTLEGHSSGVTSVAFSHDSKLLVSASHDTTVQFWDTATGTLQQTLKGHSGCVTSDAFSHDSKLLASASDDRTVRLWDAATGMLQQTLEGHSDSVTSVTFSHDSKLLASVSDDTTVRLWDTATGTLQQTLEGHSISATSVAFSHDSKLLASASYDETVRLWDAATGTLQQKLKGHSSSVTSVAFSHDSKLLASVSRDKIVRLWDAATGILQQTLEGHSDSVTSVAFSYDSKLLASVSHDTIVRLWDTATGTLQQTLEGHSISVTSIAFSHDSKLLASASHDTIVRLWDTATGTLQQTLEGHSSSVTSVAFSHDSKLLASASHDETVRLWDTATGTLQQTLKGHSDSVTSVAFSHDSKLLASASDDETVRLWDTAIGTLQQTLEGHSDSVTSVAFSHDSKLLASASHDETVRLWDAATGTLQQTTEFHSYVSTISFDITDSILITNRGRVKVDRNKISSMSISSQEAGSKSNYEGLGISDSWVTWNDQNLIWLPPEFRAITYDVSLTGSTLAIGCKSGTVFFIGVSLDILHRYYS